MRVRDATNDGESDAEASRCTTSGGVETGEPLEHPLTILCRDSRTIVVDR